MASRTMTWCAQGAGRSRTSVRKSWGWWPSGAGCREDSWWSGMQWMRLACSPVARRLKMIRDQGVFEVMYVRRNEMPGCAWPGWAWRSHDLTRRSPQESRLVARSTKSQILEPTLPAEQSHGRGVQLRRGVQEPRPGCGDQRPASVDDQLPGVVACGLWPLWAVVHPYGVAQCRHLPYCRWARWRRRRHAAVCSAEQLAGQREPG